MAQPFGNAVPPFQAEGADGQVPQGSQRPRRTAGPYPRGILPEPHVSYMVLTILDRPVPAYAFGQVSGCRLATVRLVTA